MVLKLNTVQVLIFDLDDTLFDTYGLLVGPATRESCQAMIDKGLDTNIDECLRAREEIFKTKSRSDIYTELTKRFGVGKAANFDEVSKAGSKAFYDREIKEPIKLFEKAIETLLALKEKYKIYLVTLGTPERQKKKVELLGLKNLFEEIFYVDINLEKSKKSAFLQILSRHNKLLPSSFISIGNRIDSEIKEGGELGMQKILMLHGEYLHLKPQSDFESPDARINQLEELQNLLLGSQK